MVLLIENLLKRITLLWLKKNETKRKVLNFEVNDRVKIIEYKNIFSKVYTENSSWEILIIDSVLKTNCWTYKLKNLNGGQIIGSFSKKELLGSILYKWVLIHNQIVI